MNRKNFLRSFRSSQPVTGKRWKLSFILTLTILILMLSSILSVNVARADELTAAAISDSTIYGTWTGSGGSGTATANGQTIPITMSYVGVEILYPETYAVGNKNVTLRSLVVNANTGEALHESTGTATLTRSQLLIAATRGRSPIRQSARDLP